MSSDNFDECSQDYKVFDLDETWIEHKALEVPKFIETVLADAEFTNENFISLHLNADLLLRCIGCVDLALLPENETSGDIENLCNKAAAPLSKPLLERGLRNVHCAAVCVYPSRILDAAKAFKQLETKVTIASVAAGFPSGQLPLQTRLGEISFAVQCGATEIDVVIDRNLVLKGRWEGLYREILEMRRTCPKSLLKVILSVTECGSLINIYKAAITAMCAGADFIKTSTGKEATAATVKEGLVMCKAIKDFHEKFEVKVGLKPAGGIRTVHDMMSWALMVKLQLGEEWLQSTLFRIGASLSSLFPSIETELLRLTQ